MGFFPFWQIESENLTSCHKQFLQVRLRFCVGVSSKALSFHALLHSVKVCEKVNKLICVEHV